MNTIEKGKYTAGPWNCSIPRRPNGELAHRAYVYSETTHEYTAECFMTDESGANARLIAAAPELLEALYGAVNVMGAWADLTNGTRLVFAKAQAAITKAEGQS